MITSSGVRGSRTLVQTGNQLAFYTLISVFVFVMRQDLNYQPHPYPLKFHQSNEACRDYFRIYDAPLDQIASEQQPFE